MKRALQFAFDMAEPGGGQMVAAWAAQALLRAYEVTLVVWERPSLERIDAACGTELAQARNLTLWEMPAWTRHLFRLQPMRAALLRRTLLERRTWDLADALDPEVIVSTSNEIDLGRPLVQYVHYPWRLYPRPEAERRWYHPPALVGLYTAFARRLSRFDPARQAGNLTLVNSDWTGARYRDCYSLPSHTLYPPVPVKGAGRDWAEREEAFVVVGRIAPEKRLIEAVRVLAQVRSAGRDVALRICGQPYDPAYLRALRAEIAAAGSWATLHLCLSRTELLEQIGRSRYGLHMMIDEHFGIAVAEMLCLGCIPFVHGSGGPLEMLGDLPLHFQGDEQAVARILDCLAEPAGHEELRRQLAMRASLFGTETFMTRLLAYCAELASATTRLPALQGQHGWTGKEL